MQCCLCCIHHIQFTGVMEVSLPEGEWLEEISSDALDTFVQNQSGYAEGFVRFMPSGQVIEKLRDVQQRAKGNRFLQVIASFR